MCNNAVQYITANHDLSNKHIVELTSLGKFKLAIISCVKVEYVTELLYWITLHCIGVLNKVPRECVYI